MGAMKNLAIDVEYGVIVALNRHADQLATDGDTDLHLGLHTRATLSYRRAARYRRAAIALRDGRPIHADDAVMVGEIRVRIERATLIAFQVVNELEAAGGVR